MPLGERDAHTGWPTTGHDWNGILELNTPVPRPVWFFLVAAVIFSIGYWILMPAWPLVTTYTKGILGNDQRVDVQESIQSANTNQRAWIAEVIAAPIDAIARDPALMAPIRETGTTLFEDNCSACHGRDGDGGEGFPRLADGIWQWGGSPEDIHETLRVGVNSLHPETRIGLMQAFGRDGILDREAVLGLVSHVRSLSGLEDMRSLDAEAVELAATAFAENCATCHGDDGKGIRELGGPNLTDDDWVYGSDPRDVFETIWNGREGWMPSWEGRLSEAERKILSVFVLDLAGEFGTQ